MVTVQYRRWCPPQSPLRIEFPPELLHDVRLQDTQPIRPLSVRWIPRINRVVTQSNGLLFGVRGENEIRVLAVTQRDGLAPVGIFVCRERGEVFLTDDDLAEFEKHQVALALVVAGGQAGFFVRQPDGSVQAIRSHEEFKVADAASCPAPVAVSVAGELPAPASRSWHHAFKWVAASALFLAIPAGAFAYLRPLMPSLPIAISIREEAGQLVMGWNSGVLADGSRLEITDGSDRSILLLPTSSTGATFRPQSDNVEVRLSTGTRMGGAHWEAARFVPKVPHGIGASTALQDRIGALTLEAEELRKSLEFGEARTKDLAARLAAAIRER